MVPSELTMNHCQWDDNKIKEYFRMDKDFVNAWPHCYFVRARGDTPTTSNHYLSNKKSQSLSPVLLGRSCLIVMFMR